MSLWAAELARLRCFWGSAGRRRFCCCYMCVTAYCGIVGRWRAAEESCRPAGVMKQAKEVVAGAMESCGRKLSPRGSREEGERSWSRGDGELPSTYEYQ